jgi:hypothetical protein
MPRKTFTAGEVLAAADVNLYLSNEVTLTASTATTYTVATADRYKTLSFTNAGTTTVTISTTTDFQAGERVDILRDGAGAVRITRSGTAITLAGRGTATASFDIGQRYDAVSVLCVGTNSYRIIGNTTPV